MHKRLARPSSQFLIKIKICGKLPTISVTTTPHSRRSRFVIWCLGSNIERGYRCGLGIACRQLADEQNRIGIIAAATSRSYDAGIHCLIGKMPSHETIAVDVHTAVVTRTQIRPTNTMSVIATLSPTPLRRLDTAGDNAWVCSQATPSRITPSTGTDSPLLTIT